VGRASAPGSAPPFIRGPGWDTAGKGTPGEVSEPPPGHENGAGIEPAGANRSPTVPPLPLGPPEGWPVLLAGAPLPPMDPRRAPRSRRGIARRETVRANLARLVGRRRDYAGGATDTPPAPSGATLTTARASPPGPVARTLPPAPRRGPAAGGQPPRARCADR